MSQTLPVAAPPDPHPLDQPVPGAWELLKKLLKPLASLKLTVVLMLLAMILVFAGTLAQKELGIHSVVSRYFRSWIVLIPVRVFFLWNTDLPKEVAFPFPGGYSIGFALLFNLVAAHLVRFQPSWRRIGIWIIHVGVIVLMLGELLTGLLQVESRMVIEEGKASNYVEDHHEFELAFVNSSAPGTDQVAVVPARLLRKAKGRLQDARLPVQIEVTQYMTNSKIEDAMPTGYSNQATQGAGKRHFAVEQPEVSGVDQDAPVDTPAAYLRFFDAAGAELGVWLLAFELKPQLLEVDGNRFEISLRFRRTYKPYTLHLKRFTHEVYPGTDKPKDYRSHIHVIDPTTDTDREVEIYMNTPLRFGGETFYQSGFLDPRTQGATGTILQVVRNPAWTMPYVSCTLVTLGMMVHFGMVLVRFLQKEPAAVRPVPPGGVR